MARLGKYFYIAAVSGFDPDAQAFFDRVTAATGSLSAIEKTAVNTLVKQMKLDGTWTPMKAIYPMVGASAAACAQNLKSASFTGTFSSGWTFASTGVTPNGTSAFFDSNFNPTGNLSITSLAFGGYTSTATQKDGGYNGSLSPNFLHSWYGYNLAESFISSQISTSGGILGLMQNNLQGGFHKLFKNNTIANSAARTISSIPNQNMYVGACNAGGASFFDNHLVSYYYYADGLTDTQASNFYTAVQAFQTTLNRYVDAPWYDNGNLLLDDYPSAAAAYSVRKLRNNYIGGPIRVRRSSDNAEQDIYFDANGNLDTAQLTSFCGAGNGFVTTWYDQSGNARNATQTTAANQPQIVSSGAVITENSKSAIQFTGANTNYMQFSSITTNPFTILWVSKKSNQSGTTSIILAGSRNGNDYMGDDVDNEGNPTAYTGTGIIRTALSNTSASGAENTQHLAYLNRRNSTQAVGQFNNSNNSYNNSVSSNNAIIDSIAYYGSSYNFAGVLQEIIIYNTDESANRTGISTNINTYYAIY